MVHKIGDFQEGEGLHSPDINSVITISHVVKQQITAMGGNDSEFNSIDAIVAKAKDGTLAYVEAILQIEFIKESKHGNGGHGLQG